MTVCCFTGTEVARAGGLERGDYRDVIEGGAFVAIGDAFDADFVPWSECDVERTVARGGIATDFGGGEMVVGGPLVDELA